MQSPVKEPSTRKAAPTSGALPPLRARQTISSALPSLSAMATPEALVKAWARCATTARSSGEAPRVFLLAGLLAVSEAWVAMLIAVPQRLNFGLACPDPSGKHSVVKNARQETRRLKSPVRLPWGRHSKSRQRIVQPTRHFKLSKLQNNYWIGEKSRRGRLMPAAFVGDSPLVSEGNACGDG